VAHADHDHEPLTEPMTTSGAPSDRQRGLTRRLQTALYRHPAAQVLLLLAPPVGWFGVLYLGSLAILFVSAFWYLDPLTSAIKHDFTLANFQLLLGTEVYRTIALRTIGIAAIVTLLDIALAFPIAFFMARVATGRMRSALFALVLLPLWTSYLVRVYAWRVILGTGGPLDWFFRLIGMPNVSLGYSDLSMVIVFTYLWLPYMILPIFAGLERIPSSLLEASADLGARSGMTFRRVVLPLAVPAVAAGSIFTFSLTLGDYITPELVSNSQFIGNVVYQSQGVAGNVPLAAAFATVPVLVMGVFLLVMRRLGAFEAL
jgi:putative spermidine/putrescine transport system permease protein